MKFNDCFKNLCTKIFNNLNENNYNYLVHSVGFLSEIFFSYSFWGIVLPDLIRGVFGVVFVNQNIWRYGLLIFLCLFVFLIVPSLCLIFLNKFRQIGSKFIIFCYICVFFSLVLIIFRTFYLRLVSQLVCLFVMIIFIDIKLSEKDELYRDRFIQSQFPSMFISCFLRFINFTNIPFYSSFYYILFIVWGFGSLVWISAEEVLKLWGVRIKIIQNDEERFEKSIGSITENKKCKGCFWGHFSLLTWCLGFSGIVYLVLRFVLVHSSLLTWSGFGYGNACLILFLEIVGMLFLANFSVFYSPWVVSGTSLPLLVLMALVKDPSYLFLVELLLVLLLPALINFYLKEYNYVKFNSGGFGLSMTFTSVLCLFEISAVFYSNVPFFGTIFKNRGGDVIFLIIAGLILISFFSFYYNRVHLLVNSYNTKMDMVVFVLFPHHYSRWKTVANFGTTYTEINGEIEEEDGEYDRSQDDTAGIIMSQDIKIKKKSSSGTALGRLGKISSKLFVEKRDEDENRWIFNTAIWLIVIVSFLWGVVWVKIFLSGSAVSPFQRSVLKISSYNVQNGFDLNSLRNSNQVFDFLVDKKIDIMGFQESGSFILTGYESVVDYISTKGNMYMNRGLPQYKGISSNVGLVSNFQIVESSNIPFPSDDEMLGNLLSVGILYNDTVFHLKIVHLADTGYEKSAISQISFLLKHCKSVRKGPLICMLIFDYSNKIVLGDFNSSPNSTVYQMIIDDGFVDTQYSFHGKYLPTIDTGETIDYIFYKGNVDIVDAVVHNNIKVSDHYPLVVEFKFRRYL